MKKIKTVNIFEILVKHKGKILIGLIMVILLACGVGYYIVKSQPIPEEEAFTLADDFIVMVQNEEWGQIYDHLALANVTEFTTRNIFIDQLSENKELIFPDGFINMEEPRIQWDYNKEGLPVKAVISYKTDDRKESYELGIIYDSNGNPWFDLDNWMETFSMTISTNSEFTLNNIMVNHNFLVDSDTLNQENYQMELFRGAYPVSIRSSYGIPEDLVLYIGLPDESGTVTTEYEQLDFAVSEEIQEDCLDVVNKFIKYFFSGIDDEIEFNLSENYYDVSLSEEIASQQLLYQIEPLPNYSIKKDTKPVESVEPVEPDMRIDSQGKILLKQTYTLIKSSDDNPIEEEKTWNFTLKKQGEYWIIQNVEY
jgi:hypothetical protein